MDFVDLIRKDGGLYLLPPVLLIQIMHVINNTQEVRKVLHVSNQTLILE
jgi:hypothetical protein